MTPLLAQINDPNFAAGVAWLVGLCIVLLTLGGSAVIVQKLVINNRVLRRGDVPQQIHVENETQKRTIELLPTLVTKLTCDERHAILTLGTENLIKLRTMEQLAAYETMAKTSREKLHNQIGELRETVSAVKTEINGLKSWMQSTSETLQNVSNGLSNLAGTQGKG